MQQDFLLVRKMKSGDEEAMDAFVRKYYPKILQYCFYHCTDKNAAQDLTQETFVRFFSSLADYRHKGKALNYLYTIAGNLCIDWGRKQRKCAMTGYDSQMLETWEKTGDYACACVDSLAGIDERLSVEEALRKLPAEMFEVVILHYFHELSLREIAEVMQIGLPLVKYRIKRAKELLRGYLESC